MGRLVLDPPTALGRECDEDANGHGELDRTTEQFVRWFDCWAGR